jgi:hypothetical protein
MSLLSLSLRPHLKPKWLLAALLSTSLSFPRRPLPLSSPLPPNRKCWRHLQWWKK